MSQIRGEYIAVNYAVRDTGTIISLLKYENLGTASYNSFEGIGKNVALGTAMGGLIIWGCLMQMGLIL